MYVARFLPRIEFHGGINVPKTIEAEGSDGVRYKHLVKVRPLRQGTSGVSPTVYTDSGGGMGSVGQRRLATGCSDGAAVRAGE